MKSLISIIAFLMLSFTAFCQGGVNFEHITFDEALAKAKAENKLVFMDCYTSWCGPCKYMTSNVFPQEIVGDYFNEHFVCLKVDMEKGEGPALAKRYGIRAFPTFLILRPDGSVYHKLLGSGEADAFLRRVQEGMVEENSTGYLDRLYEEGNRDKAFLSRYIQSLLSIYEENKAKEVSAVLLGLLDESEKVDSSYWFIFESPALTKKEVDNKLYAVYYNQLSYILKGYDKKSTIEDVVNMKNEIKSFKLEKRKELSACIDITEAYLKKDVKGLYSRCKKGFKLFHDDEAMNIAFPVLKYLKTEMQQEDDLQKLVLMLEANIEDESLKKYISMNIGQ